MLNLLSSNTILAQSVPGVFTYFSQSNLSGQIIVIALAVFSLIAWTVMIGKHMELNRFQRLNKNIASKLHQSPAITAVNIGKETGLSGPFAGLVRETIATYYKYQGKNQVIQSTGKSLSVAHIENSLQREVAKHCITYESKMVMLGSIVSGAPFLGLLGTVWGVMDAFGTMGLQSSATLQALAPGVSGALLTTVAGLLVAIPSVFGYNYLLSKTKQMIIDLENFASSLADRVELEME